MNTTLPAAFAEVVLDSVVNGDITVTPLGEGTTQDMTATDGAIGYFSDFDIAAGHVVSCVQPSSSSNALFKIFSGDGTQILGQFDANGNIYLIDPAGILFGAGSQVNVNRLVASSLDISNDDFLNGRYEFTAGAENAGAIVNDGTINAAEGVALIGRQILNTGTISTGENGFVVMAAGDRVLLGEPGSHILVEMNSVALPEEGDGDVINDGQISAPAGTVILAAGDVFTSALELPKVSGGIGRVEQNGEIHVDGTTGDGGNISLTGADEVVLASGSQTTANAGTDSDAGLIVVHSLDRTTVEAGAQIQAIGGQVPRDLLGDFDDVVDTTIEISGDYVNFAGDVDASATGGKRGKIVIDALDMTVADGSMPADPPDNTVYEKWIEEQSNAATDVELVTHSKEAGNITVESIADGEITGGSGDIVLRMKYDTGGIIFEGDPAAIHTTLGGNVYMLAGAGGITVGDITTDVPSNDKITEPGKIRLLTTNGGDIMTGQLSVKGGSYDEISVIADGDLTVNGSVYTATNQVPSETQLIGQARTCLVSEHGSVLINGEIQVEGHGKFESTADIHIDAGQDITINLDGGQIRATAKTSQTGPANASVLIHAGMDVEGPGTILITDDGVNPTTRDNAIFLDTKAGGGSDSAEISSNGQPPVDLEETDNDAHAKLEVDEDRGEQCSDCPTPPGLVPPLDPWAYTTHMNVTTSGNVFEGENKVGILEVVPDDSWVQLTPDTWQVQTAHGTVIIARNGDYQYTPDDGFVGQDRFTYKAKVIDTGVETDLVEVTITVTNSTPIQEDDVVIMEQSQRSVIINVLANDYDPDYPEYMDTLTVVQDSITVQHGELILNADNTFTYIPDPGYVGQDSFTYAVRDGQNDQELIWTTVIIWVNNAVFIPAAPLPEPIVIEVSGCPALINWVAAELGTDQRNVQIWMKNALASTSDIQPCDTCSRFKAAATILRDLDGTRVAAMAQVVGKLASGAAPPAEEQMASIADAIANDVEGNRQYAAAGEYLDALAKYVGVLTGEMGFSTDEAIQFATDNYIQKLAEGENMGVAAFVAARLVALGGS